MTVYTRPVDYIIVSLYNGHENPTPYFYIGGDTPFSKERAKAARYFERHHAEVMKFHIEAEGAYGARLEIWTLEPEHA
jgi:hypothetical protein